MKNQQIPEITKTFCACHDGGFNSNKGAGVDVSDLSPQESHHIPSNIVYNLFTARTAPLHGLGTDAAGRILTQPVEGISGDDAIRLQPGLWSCEHVEDHYASPTYLQYLFQNLADMFILSGVTPNTHVKVFLSLGINNMHFHHAEAIHLRLTSQTWPVQLMDGRQWFVTFGNVEIKRQPFWVMVDALMKYDADGRLLPPDVTPLKKGACIAFDCGSNTFQALVFQNNMQPIDDFCEGIGVWDTIKRNLKKIVMQKAYHQGVTLSDPQLPQLMEAYEAGVYRTGKHEINIQDDIDAMNALKIRQRLALTKSYFKSGDGVQDMIFAGGDAAVNLPEFRAFYDSGIKGKVALATDQHGDVETLYRLADGGLKGAVRQWLKSFK